MKVLPTLAALVALTLAALSAPSALAQATAPCSLSPAASSAAQARIQATCAYASQDAATLANGRRWHVNVAADACQRVGTTGSTWSCAASVRYGKRLRLRCTAFETLRGRSKDPARLRLVARGLVC